MYYRFIIYIFILLVSCNCNKNYFNFKKQYDEFFFENLFKIVKQTTISQLNENKYNHFVDIDYTDKDTGIAVRFLKNGKDRGCISFYRGVSDIDTACEYASINAAFFDTRYKPITKEELNNLEVEITIFGKFNQISDYYNFDIGIHSLWIYDYSNHGLLQAQIATQEKYNKNQFLEALCKKANMDKESYKNRNILLYKAFSTFKRKKFSNIEM
ncbi:MAG: hypothetical protein A2086_16265 [Spirochaetes bacterium GWD1_27_9]|nr:MAG: hypothetical protein A2Z98_10780 [Spirochaetes bacterium GWB1_27_13]OHD24635.1 MAG: hypothetical protein A2Y34_00495 [Spirochaetes bacterium GWC1_27_15]OHD44630.1 MAG: hypothetical protein A2086_16265 [Spirochaetes bacterium GWD1_27_9]